MGRTDRRTDPTDRRTDTTSYRDAYSHLKRMKKKKFHNEQDETVASIRAAKSHANDHQQREPGNGCTQDTVVTFNSIPSQIMNFYAAPPPFFMEKRKEKRATEINARPFSNGMSSG